MRFLSIIFNTRRGFTLTEVMVVIGITLLLTGITFGYNRNSELQLVVYREQAIIIGMLNRAKSLTLQKFRSSDDQYETCAFGLRVTPPRTIVLFQDLGKGGCRNQDPVEVLSRYRYTPEDRPELIETKVLDSRISIIGLPEEGLDLAFIPPDLGVTSSISVFPIRFTLQSEDLESEASLSLSSVGQVLNN